MAAASRPEELYVARRHVRGTGLGDRRTCGASEALAFSSETRRVVTEQDGSLLLVTAQGVPGLDPARVTVAEDTKLGTAPVCGTRGT
jgi:hypothetical protein